MIMTVNINPQGGNAIIILFTVLIDEENPLTAFDYYRLLC